MSSPLYMRRRSSSRDYYTAPQPYKGTTSFDGTVPQDNAANQEEEGELHITGLRRRKLMALIIWLAVLMLLVILLFVINLTLINTLQMNYHGMKALRVHSYVDDETGEKEAAVHFASPNIDLGHVVAKTGKVVGPRDKRFDMHGTRIMVNTAENDTRLLLQEGQCRFENVQQFQVLNGVSGKAMFSALHPLISIDKRIKKISSQAIITNKIRSPVNDNLLIQVDNVNLRGNEAIRMESRRFNATARTILHLKTSSDGSIRVKARKVFFGSQWKTLPISSSPSLTASVDAYRVCVCSTARAKLFLVDGNKPCNAKSEVCQ